MVKLTTSLGDIVIELHEDEAPISCQNFKQYVEDGFYDGTIFHRVIPGFMVQGGGMTPAMDRKSTRDPIKNEAQNGLSNARGTLAMARTQVVDSATSQFFINLKDNDFLNHGTRDFGYAVFGRVAEGMDTVDAIAGVDTTTKNGHRDVPQEPVFIERAEIVEAA
ncbi:MAG: peptidylprolyl isomerase [Bacteroidota bacterium]